MNGRNLRYAEQAQDRRLIATAIVDARYRDWLAEWRQDQ